MYGLFISFQKIGAKMAVDDDKQIMEIKSLQEIEVIHMWHENIRQTRVFVHCDFEHFLFAAWSFICF